MISQVYFQEKYVKRFWDYTDRPNPASHIDCWNWKKTITPGGYGKIFVKGKAFMAHRYSFFLHGGKIKKGLQLDHLCRNRQCVNPSHLEAVTNKENVLRGIGITAQNARKQVCKYGHEFNTKNTHIGHKMTKKGTEREFRVCRACQNIYSLRSYYKTALKEKSKKFYEEHLDN